MDKFLQILDEKDKTIFKQIEAIRQDIRDKDQLIHVLDFGAGDPDSNRTVQQMNQGVHKTISTKDLCQIGLKNEFAHLLYALVKRYKPQTLLELGTCCGFSSIYMSKALDNTHAIIHTIEGSPETATIAQANIAQATCQNIISHVGKFSDILPTLLKNIEPIDFAFIDGHHDKDATLQYYEQIKPYLNNDAIVIFDDISWSEGMKEAWSLLKEDELINKSYDLEKLGICFYGDLA